MAADNFMDKVGQILGNKDAMSQISQMLGGGDAQNSGPSDAQIEMANKISQITSKMSEPDPKINLLYALKPYMSASRTEHIDKAIKMIQMTKITGFFKDF